MGGGDADGVRSTGGQVDEMVMALIDAAYDKDGAVKQVITDSLFELGKKQPALVLSSCHSYLVKHSKLPVGHRIVILTSTERILKETLNEVEQSLAENIIKQASFELTSSKEVQPEWQTAASNVLVAVGMKYCNEVMAELHQKFQPGILPHFFVLQTMANLSVANVYGMVPFLKGVLGQMLPMLGMAKQDNMRWVFSTALAKFSEAILDYVANIEKAPDPAVRKEAFAGEIDAAYDVVFNVWLNSRESRLRVAIVEALGQMVHVMTWQKLHDQLPKLLQTITGLYRKHSEPYHVTQGLGMILDAATTDGSTILEPHLDNLLNGLFPQACQPVDYSSPSTVKNHNELLRCFSALSKSFADKLIAFLLIKLEVTNDRTRIGTLSIFRHLVNSSEQQMEGKKDVVVSGLKVVLTETNNKVKKALAQLIIAMAHHGYLELEGGQLMIEFIVRQCSLLPDLQSGKKSPDPEYVSNESLRMMCDNVLHLLSTTVDNMDVVLWPYLLECVVPEQYTEAMGTVCRSIGHIAAKKREDGADDFEIDYEKEVNIPKPTVLVARMMVMAGRPQNGRNRGTHVLHAMKALSPNFNEGLVEIWDTVIPKLIQFLEDAVEDEEKWSQKTWEDLALKMLSKSLDVVDNEDWVAELGEAFGQQIPLYNLFPEEKNFLYKCMGVVMRKSTKKEFVAKHLDLIFSTVKHTSQLEREGCAIAAGFTAASHLDSAIAKLDSIMKNDSGKKSGGFLGFIKDQVNKSDIDEKTKATLMLCYGYVALYAPASLIVSRLETTILKAINPHFNHVKDPGVKQNLIRAVELIGKTMHPEHLQSNHSFSQRSDLVGHMENFMKAEPTNHIHNETRALAMNCCSTLVKLDPKMSDSEVFELVKTCLDCYISLPPGGVKKDKDETYEDHLESESFMKITQDALQDVMCQIVTKDPTPDGLDSVFKHLHPWTLSEEEYERERAMELVHHIFQLYFDKVDTGLGICANFHNFGIILAKLIPRCSDPDLPVRQHGIDCVHKLLKIQQRYQGLPSDHKDHMVDALPTLKDRLKKTDPNILFSVVNDLAKVVGKSLPSDQLIPFLNQLYDALLDPQSHSSSGACVVLNSVVKSRGGELHTEVEKLVNVLHDKLGQITCPQTRTGSLRCVRTLASHHLISVLNTLLNYPLPLDENVVACWQIISQDPHLMAAIIDHVLDLLSRGLPYEEKPGPREKDPPIRTATLMPLAATVALGEIFKVQEAVEPIMNNYHRLMGIAMIRVASSVNVKAPHQKNRARYEQGVDDDEKDEKKSKEKKTPATKESDVKPSSVSVEALQNLLKASKNEDLWDAMESQDVWWKFEDEEEYPEAFTEFAKLLCQYQPQHVSKVITALNPVLSSIYEPQRVMAAAFFAELINQKCAGDMALVEMLVNGLLGRLVDNSHVVRKLCIRGLGNVASNGPEQVQKYSTTVLSAMMAGMDDKDDLEDDITLEAMSGLSKILAEIDESHIRAILINISLRIRPCFEKDRAGVRAAAFTLFGNLSRFGDGPSKSPFLEQIHTNLVSLLLHLNDPELEVRKSCKYSLRLLGPLIGSDNINNMFQKVLLDDATLHYGEFMNDLSKVIIQDFPDKLNFCVMGNVSFFKSMWPEIKGNAAMFVGFLLGNMPQEKYASISKEHVCGALILLLKDSSSDVRVKAAEAMGKLFDF